MKRILLIHYSQSGQGKSIADSILNPVQSNSEFLIDEYSIQANPTYPFPWSSDAFFDSMPESVYGIPCFLNFPEGDFSKAYDLIFFVYPVWYLSPAIPAASFLQSDEGKKLLAGKKVITVSGLRNMGVAALEDLKNYLTKMDAKLVGNIALRDTHNNLISVLTIIRWLMKGQKQASGNLPEAGVRQSDIEAASRFGEIIRRALEEDRLDTLNDKLLQAGANELSYAVTNMEINAKRIFKVWAKLILKKGPAHDPKRIRRVRFFKYYLLAVIFIVSPIAGLVFNIKKLLFPKEAKKQLDYYKMV